MLLDIKFETSAPADLKQDHDHWKVSGTPMYYYCPRVPNFSVFRSVPMHFRANAILRIGHWMLCA